MSRNNVPVRCEPSFETVMSAVGNPAIPVTLERQGRLPPPPGDSLLPHARFETMARHWRSMGVWLSLWNADGKILFRDEEGPDFWNQLWCSGSTFQDGLANEARRYCRASDDVGARVDGDGPWPDDLVLFRAPVHRRSRVLGVMIGTAIVSDLSGESFVRLCDACRLDQRAVRTQGMRIRRLDRGLTHSIAEVFALTVRQAREVVTLVEESHSLTRNLESTYEELNLVYRVSAEMGLPQQPEVLLGRVGSQTAEVSRAASVAFVLPADEGGSTETTVEGHTTARAHGPRVIVGGTAPCDKESIVRLVDMLDGLGGDARGHVLINDAGSRADFEWARPWLDHAVALPLKGQRQALGTMLGINCRDGGDFTSVDVQLLRAVADRVESFLENQGLYDQLADLLMGLLHAVVNAVDAKDSYTCGHSERVGFFSRALARAAGFDETQCERVYLAGLLHDVGKIGVPDAILCKPGRLTVDEFETLKLHPEIGVRILSPVRQTRDLLPGVLYHHERVDGCGYPHGLSGSSIPLLGRIICLADCFDAMTTNRTYRSALPLSAALSEVRRCSGTQFDPHLAELFLGIGLERLFDEAWASSSRSFALSHKRALHAELRAELAQ